MQTLLANLMQTLLANLNANLIHQSCFGGLMGKKATSRQNILNISTHFLAIDAIAAIGIIIYSAGNNCWDLDLDFLRFK